MPTLALSWRRVSWETLSPRNLSLLESPVVLERELSLLSLVQSTKMPSRLPSKSLASTWWQVTWSHWTEPSVIYAMKSELILTTSFLTALFVLTDIRPRLLLQGCFTKLQLFPHMACLFLQFNHPPQILHQIIKAQAKLSQSNKSKHNTGINCSKWAHQSKLALIWNGV